ncbi:hypothetical protein AALP_AA4G243800 [Arabis alpina]|uniref:Growth-regulating factor n=1 Tax=Arabis alpina TaxID=50452 RepID=A0A087H5D8_ARAAL|nr:hypothetical protein AALP_AA4G243800 [Arabis alpina]
MSALQTFVMKKPKMEEEEEEVMVRKKWPCMKSAQLLEFQMQTLVYRYIEAGLRVPHHLVVPIWNSLVLSTSNYHIQHNHHSSSSVMSGKVEEAEPTRCRRTDGKKWRCSNTVLPSEKYCERHMHRGRNRSRKLVESTYEVASSSASSTKQDNTYGLESNKESESVLPGAMSVSSDNASQVVTIASFPRARVCETITRPSLVISESTNNSVSHRKRSGGIMNMSYDDFLKQRDSSNCVQVVPVQGDESLPSVQKFFPEVSDISLEAAKVSSNRKNYIIASSREWKETNVNRGLFPSIHFSPDTVLQDRGGFRIHRFETADEPGRCRRTDGKKWRCSKDALSDQKYCDKHMHRGSIKRNKMQPVDTNPHENAGFNPFIAKTAARSVSCKDRDDTKLSVSVMGVPLSRVSDEKTTSSCSTDTTITDIALKGEEDNEEYLSLCSSGV